jgi:hypothetical protein
MCGEMSGLAETVETHEHTRHTQLAVCQLSPPPRQLTDTGCTAVQTFMRSASLCPLAREGGRGPRGRAREGQLRARALVRSLRTRRNRLASQYYYQRVVFLSLLSSRFTLVWATRVPVCARWHRRSSQQCNSSRVPGGARFARVVVT